MENNLENQENLNNKPDVVITYVDGNDPVWKSEILKYTTSYNKRRFRSFDNLKFLFRGIDKYMKFINNAYLVVSNIEQVPSLVNQKTVKIVLHKDIIPEKYLPTFNSTTIEMFLCFIPGLNNKFIYFNDDLFPNNVLTEDYFFENEFPKYQINHKTVVPNLFHSQCKNSWDLALKLSCCKQDGDDYMWIKHSAAPLLKDQCLEVWKKGGTYIEESLSKFRTPSNYTQYLFSDYCIINDKWSITNIDFQYFTLDNVENIKKEIEEKNHKMICINDHEVDDFEKVKKDINESFEKTLPDVCKYEKQE